MAAPLISCFREKRKQQSGTPFPFFFRPSFPFFFLHFGGMVNVFTLVHFLVYSFSFEFFFLTLETKYANGFLRVRHLVRVVKHEEKKKRGIASGNGTPECLSRLIIFSRQRCIFCLYSTLFARAGAF